MTCGTAYLIGVGPGSADLITLRGLQAVRKSDVIIGDSLLQPSLLEAWGIDTRNRTVHWRDRKNSRHEQESINDVMLKATRQGRNVARLKCGDPMVFGRGMEEATFLWDNGIRCEIIPGLCTALAGPVAAELPLTHRQTGRSFAVATARIEGGQANPDLPHADSLILLMGVETLPEHVRQLRADGWPATTPVAVIERAEQPWQRCVDSTMENIVAAAGEHGIESPAIIVFGQAARRRPDRPRLLFTGLDPANFRNLGEILHWPALEVVANEEGSAAMEQALVQLARQGANCAIFTSRIGVTSFFTRLADAGLDARVLAGTTVIAAGAGTAMRLADHGVRADAVPDDPGSRGILASVPQSLGCVVLVQGSHAPKGLVDALEARGADVLRVALHRIQPHPELGKPLPQHDAIYFVSPSGVRSYVDRYGPDVLKTDVWCMGDITLQEVHNHGGTGKVVNPYVSQDANVSTQGQ
jgi:uroporphyrinogen III methyltransferase/synthase